jgi:hypothetical protein
VITPETTGPNVSVGKPIPRLSPAGSNIRGLDFVALGPYVLPLLPQGIVVEKMRGREAVPLVRLESEDAVGRASNDWVVTGIMIRKPCLKLPLTGTQ